MNGIAQAKSEKEIIRGILENELASSYLNIHNSEYSTTKDPCARQKSILIKALDVGLEPNKALGLILNHLHTPYEPTSTSTSFAIIDGVKTTTITYPVLCPKRIELVKELMSITFARGANIQEMSFEELCLDYITLPVFQILLEHGLNPNTLMLLDLGLLGSGIEALELMQSKNVKPILFMLLS